MTLNIEMEYEKALDFDYEALANQVAEEALDFEACPYETEINLVLTGEDEIQAANREFRDMDRVTDVLSFPMVEYDTPGDFSHAEEDDSCFNPDTGELMLGDIMICIPRMQEQAVNYGHREVREFGFLIICQAFRLLQKTFQHTATSTEPVCPFFSGKLL